MVPVSPAICRVNQNLRHRVFGRRFLLNPLAARHDAERVPTLVADDNRAVTRRERGHAETGAVGARGESSLGSAAAGTMHGTEHEGIRAGNEDEEKSGK